MIMFFYGSHCDRGNGDGFVFVTPQGMPMTFSFKLSFECTNNNSEYEALILGLKLANEMKYEHLKICGDFLLIINQVKGLYACNNPCLKLYKSLVETLI